MQDTVKKWTYGVWALIPSLPAFHEFEKDNPDGIQNIAALLVQNGILEDDSRKAFEAFIQSSKAIMTDNLERDVGSFEELVKNRIHVSLNELASHLNQLIDTLKFGVLFNKIKIGSAMFSRLKTSSADTPVKRNYLRILAFYLVWVQKDFSLAFHYEKLRDLCSAKNQDREPHGIRVGFGINVIDLKTFQRLRKLLKSSMEQSELLKTLKITQLTLESTFVLYTDIPNTRNSDRISDTAPYGPGIREALSLVHQVLIKWQLKPIGKVMQPKLAIGMMAGRFDDLVYLNHMLCFKKPYDFPQIKITEFVKKCLNENNVRVTLTPGPEIIHISNEFPLYIRTVEGWWNWIYLQFLPELISHSDESQEEPVCLPNQYHPVKANSLLKTAINNFYRDTQNLLLGLEIAKTLFFQKDYMNALEIIHAILRESPNQINALTYKMAILFGGASLFDDPHRSEFQFNRANDIAERVMQFQDCMEEDVFNQIGMGRLARAIQFFRKHRERVLAQTDPDDRPRDVDTIIDMTLSAEKAFIRGDNSDSTGHRSLYYLLIIRFILATLRSGAYVFTQDGIHVTDRSLFRITAHRFFKDIGWLHHENPEKDFSGIEMYLMRAADSFGESMQLQSAKAHTYAAIVLLLHDTGIDLGPGGHGHMVGLLEKSIECALKNYKANLYTFCNTRWLNPELLSYEEYKEHIDVWLDIIKNNKDTELLFAGMFK